MTDERKPGDDEARRNEELSAYERLREETRKLFGEIRENVNADTIRETVDKARNRVREAGGPTAEALGKAVTALKKDLANTAERLGPTWETLSEKGADLFSVWRDRGRLFLSEASAGVGAWLQRLGQRLGHQSYRTGEMTYAGTFRCEVCGQHTELTHTGHLPPCGICGDAIFKRV